MVKQRRYVCKKHFQGLPKRDDFEIFESELPLIENGEFLVKAEFISVDPHQRAQVYQIPYDQHSYQVGTVIDSKNPIYPVGSKVVSHKGWCDYSILRGDESGGFLDLDTVYKLPDLKGLPLSLAVGAVGMPGATAYFGFLEICQPKAGQTVVVSGAAGAVGSLVGQIAKIKGCKVIGFAGSDDKVKWLEEDLGFDKAFNYKTVDIETVLKQAAPRGVDCYFDNVGGETSSIIMSQMNRHGRISVCGSISNYNSNPPQTPTLPILFKQLKIEDFIVTRWRSQWNEAFVQMVQWIKSGQLKAREHVTEGFDNVFDAFLGLLMGENLGKAVVKV